MQFVLVHLEVFQFLMAVVVLQKENVFRGPVILLDFALRHRMKQLAMGMANSLFLHIDTQAF